MDDNEEEVEIPVENLEEKTSDESDLEYPAPKEKFKPYEIDRTKLLKHYKLFDQY